jgi:hypothetical protein
LDIRSLASGAPTGPRKTLAILKKISAGETANRFHDQPSLLR